MKSEWRVAPIGTTRFLILDSSCAHSDLLRATDARRGHSVGPAHQPMDARTHATRPDKEMPSTQAVCLSDFFNHDLWIPERPPTYADVRDGLQELVAATLEALKQRGPVPSELLVRLYGGWYGDDAEERVEMREITAAVVEGFPRSASPRLRVQLAEAPIWSPATRLLRTVRHVKHRRMTGSVAAPGHCTQGADCSVTILQSWWRGRCPDALCSVKIGELGYARRQKMIDTLLTADAIFLMQQGEVEVLVVASDDDDFMPVYLSALAFDTPTLRLKRGHTTSKYYDGILELHGLTTHTW